MSSTKFFYIHISGIPYVFATTTLPELWEDETGKILLNEESYTWKQIVEKNLEIGETKIEAWCGIATPSVVNFSIPIDSDTKKLLNKNLYLEGRNYCSLTGNLSTQGAFVGVDNTTNFDATGYIYIGNETINYLSKTTTRFSDITRASYGSYTGSFFGTQETKEYYNTGIYVTDFPLSLNGRIVKIWQASASLSQNSNKLIPYNSYAGLDTLIFTGVLKNAQYADNLQSIQFTCTDLISLLEKQIGETKIEAILPQTLSSTIEDYKFYIDEWSDRIKFKSINGNSYFDSTLTHGVKTKNEIITNIYDNYLGADIPVMNFGSDEGKWTISLTIDNSVGYSNYDIVLDASSRSFFREMGFTQDQTASPNDNGTTSTWTFTADIEIPIFRYPAGLESKRNILVKEIPNSYGAKFTDLVLAENLILTEYGNGQQHSYFRVSDEIYEFNDFDYIYGSDGTEYVTMTVIKRACFGSGPENMAEDYYITIEDDAPIVERRFALSSMEWPRLIAYMLCSGNESGDGYDAQSWLKFGAQIPRELVDEDSFTNIARSTIGSQFHQAYLTEPQTISELISAALVLNQCYICTSNGKLTLKNIPETLATDNIGAISISENDILSINNLGIDVQEDNIINVVVGNDINYNWITGDGISKTVADGVSVGTYGQKEKLELSCKTIQNTEAELDIIDLAYSVFATWNSPFIVLNITVNSDSLLLSNVGDPIIINHSILENFLESTQIVGRIFSIKKLLKGDGARTQITVYICNQDGRRKSLWNPIAKVQSIDTESEKIYIEKNYFNGTTGIQDGAYFKEGMNCRCYNVGEEENYFIFTVRNIEEKSSNYEIIMVLLDGSYKNIDPSKAIIGYIEFDNVYIPSDEQKQYVYLANYYSPWLVDDDSNEYPPFHYA